MQVIRPAYSPPKKTKEEIFTYNELFSYSNYNKNYLIKNYLVKNYLIITTNIIITYLISYLFIKKN